MSTWNAQTSEIVGAIRPAIDDDNWHIRWDVAWYVDRCVMAGFAKTEDEKLACARRFLAGKRKVSPPGRKRRKVAEKAKRKLIASPSADLMAAIESLRGSKAHEQYLAGSDKALNALVGMALKLHKTDPAAVRELIIKNLAEAQPA